MRYILVGSRVGNLVGSLKIEFLGWVSRDRFHEAHLRFYLELHRGSYTKRYRKDVYCSEGASYHPHLRRFIDDISAPHMIHELLREADREDQLREGYYRALDTFTSNFAD